MTLLVNSSYCPTKHLMKQNLEAIENGIYLATNENKQLVFMSHLNLDYLTLTEKECLDTAIVPYNLSICTSSKPTRKPAEKSSLID